MEDIFLVCVLLQMMALLIAFISPICGVSYSSQGGIRKDRTLIMLSMRGRLYAREEEWFSQVVRYYNSASTLVKKNSKLDKENS